ncbi:hypothetical protein MIND_00315800 [Mycena indigotica]|uniref:Uncharacterized protein n=1 Tax=Mycena indigotica TaxID=2126181 RepID=A0A8H6T238_9AGAR|nr:uncharacterized protein MIND_00315800 [Mycena indigotica]KAF7309450.1 hypothetical protein MIND_00315800 [Mycena indigotica]
MLFLLSVAACFFLVIMLSFRYRDTLLPHVPSGIRKLLPATFNNYQPLSTFEQQIGAGMTSSDFDIEANLHGGDSRMGLDEAGTREVMEIMRRERVNFDQARLIRHNRILAQNGIDPSGMPIDAKAVTRL